MALPRACLRSRTTSMPPARAHPLPRALPAPPLPHRSILGDSYRTALHLQHPPHVVALGALGLAATITQLDLRAWLQGLDADLPKVWPAGRPQGGFLQSWRRVVCGIRVW